MSRLLFDAWRSPPRAVRIALAEATSGGHLVDCAGLIATQAATTTNALIHTLNNALMSPSPFFVLDDPRPKAPRLVSSGICAPGEQWPCPSPIPNRVPETVA